MPVGEVVDGARKRLDEIKALRDEIKALKRQAAGGQAGDLAAKAVDGVVVERVDGLERDTLRDLAVAAARPGRPAGRRARRRRPRAAAPPSWRPSRPTAGSTRRRCSRTPRSCIKGGGGKDPLLAVAGGKDADGIDAALDAVRAAAGHRRLVRALGIDLGTKRIGVALSDSAGTLATPYEVVARSGDRGRDHRAHRRAGRGGRGRGAGRRPAAVARRVDRRRRRRRPWPRPTSWPRPPGCRSRCGTSASPPSPPIASSWRST